MSIREIAVDLGSPPSERWSVLRPQADVCRAMLRAYLTDLGDLDPFRSLLDAYVRDHVSPDHLAEMQSISEIVDVPLADVLVANLYYDAMSVMLGCTAFAVDTADGPLHSRNLDWWSPGTALSDETVVYKFVERESVRFYTVSWPGFMGALSGMAPGRFAVTLNAVLSLERPPLATSITLLLRRVLEDAASYDDAVEILSNTPLLSSSLLLISGTRDGEMCVIERTPTRARIRKPEHGSIVVTNDYRLIDPDKPATIVNELQQTSCGRFDRASKLVLEHRPSTVETAMRVLRDSQVQMKITAQQMVFRARSALLHVELPSR